MKIVIKIEIDEDNILDLLTLNQKNENFQEVFEKIGEAVQVKVGAEIKSEVAKTIVELCKQSEIPLGDLIKSNG